MADLRTSQSEREEDEKVIVVGYVYRCSDTTCARASGNYVTSIAPHIFPQCKWCGRLLEFKREIEFKRDSRRRTKK